MGRRGRDGEPEEISDEDRERQQQDGQRETIQRGGSGARRKQDEQDDE